MSTFYGGPEVINVLSISGTANGTINTLYVVPSGRYAEVQLVSAQGSCNNGGVQNGGRVGGVIYALDTTDDGTPVNEDYKDYPGALQILNEGETVDAIGTANFGSINVRIIEYVKP